MAKQYTKVTVKSTKLKMPKLALKLTKKTTNGKSKA